MATSRFTIYTSADPYGPGPMNGTTGSLITVLDACLVNGYGTGQYTKTSAGWSKPLGSISASCVSAYTQPSGSRMTLFVNDNATTTARTAAVTGWTVLSQISGTVNASNVGIGYGQFPMPFQSNTVGKVFWYKSATADTVQRNWIIAADAYTMYIWFQDGQSTNTYYHGGFGDIYSIAGGINDLGRCCLFGKYGDNITTITSLESTDCINYGMLNSGAQWFANYQVGHYLAKNASGTGYPVRYGKKGDSGISTFAIANSGESPYLSAMNGGLPCPNPYDNGIYLAPIYIFDPALSNGTSASMRGRYRGIYQMCHPLSNFVNGQIIQGTGVYSGKQFMIIYPGYNGGGWVLEISNTVETNS